MKQAEASKTRKLTMSRAKSLYVSRSNPGAIDALHEAVACLELTMRPGQISSLLGANGAGKSTTIAMLTGLLPPSAGEARLFGRPLDPRDLATRRRVGYLSQSFSLYSELQVRQNLELHARLFALQRMRAARSRISTKPELVPLDVGGQQRPGSPARMVGAALSAKGSSLNKWRAGRPLPPQI